MTVSETLEFIQVVSSLDCRLGQLGGVHPDRDSRHPNVECPEHRYRNLFCQWISPFGREVRIPCGDHGRDVAIHPGD